MDTFHTPVLLQEIIGGLHVRPGKKYIDATLGGGGHAIEIVKRGGKVLGIDVDQEAIEYVKKKVGSEKLEVIIGEDLILVKGNFRDIGEIAKAFGFREVAGVLFDLGVSSHQLKTPERGFSFQKEGPLDMRMAHSLPAGGSGQGVTAADLVNGLYEHELIYLFEKYGEERLGRRIADAICRAREVKKIGTTRELARIVEAVYYGRKGATSAYARATADKQVFQALRIAVNDELGNLQQALPQTVDLLEQGGRIAVISFHSLEDRIVKNFFKGHEVTKKPIMPSGEEIKNNPRARSAKLRIYKQSL